jgi:hypothetical protein
MYIPMGRGLWRDSGVASSPIVSGLARELMKYMNEHPELKT